MKRFSRVLAVAGVGTALAVGGAGVAQASPGHGVSQSPDRGAKVSRDYKNKKDHSGSHDRSKHDSKNHR